MNNAKDTDLTKEMLDCFSSLPKEAFNDCMWALQHPEYVESMACTKPFSKEKSEKLIQNCLKRKDYLMLFLVIYKKVYDEKVFVEHSYME